MAVSPMYVGQTGPVMQVSIKSDDGTAAPLAGAIMLLTIHNNYTEVDRMGAGGWTVIDPVNGVAQYAWDITDTAVAGSYSLMISYLLSGTNFECDPIDWQLLAR